MNVTFIDHDGQIPTVLVDDNSKNDLVEFVKNNTNSIEELIVKYGALLFRGYEIRSEEKFEKVVSALSSNRMTYDYGSTPRTNLGSGIYTATEYPSNLEIPLHNECSYQTVWPSRLVFCCTLAPAEGGQTPLADMRKVHSALSDEVISEFEVKKVRYVRHYRPYVDVPWQTVFQTSDKEELEKICADHDIQMSWLEPELLRTVQICQGVAHHPVTNESVFFNQAHLFHLSSHNSEQIEALIDAFSADQLPRTSFFGDGSEIPVDTINTIREAFKDSEIQFDWQSGDVLLLDNMRVAHGRRKYSGDRKVLTALLDPIP